MGRTIFGVVIAAIVIYLWGFVYWGLGPFNRHIWKQTADNEAAGRALLEHFPERGTYFVPNSYPDPQKAEAIFKTGPVAMIHMLAPKGRPMADPTIMGGGFVLNLVVIVLVVLVLKNTAASTPTYFSKLGLLALIGVTASLLIDGGDAVWWQVPWQWKLYQAFYNTSVWIIAGAILAPFVTSKKPAETT
jgi:hypothetical protein